MGPAALIFSQPAQQVAYLPDSPLSAAPPRYQTRYRLHLGISIRHTDGEADLLHAGQIVDVIAHIGDLAPIDPFFWKYSQEQRPLVRAALMILELELLTSPGDDGVGLQRQHQTLHP